MERFWKCRKKSIELGRKTLIMGILNITPDSFFDGGKYDDFAPARRHLVCMIEDGADIIDIGGESSRPFAEPVSTEEELVRTIPIIEEFANQTVISIDTCKPEVAEQALLSGASIINDISGFRDGKMVDIAVKYQAGVVIMHMKGNPGNMQVNPVYDDVIAEVSDYLRKQAEMLVSKGLDPACIVVDPGIGFGKTAEDNFTIIRELGQFTEIGYPVLLGASRKSFMKAVGFEDAHNRLEGSIAAAVAGVINGASILRVHDVSETAKAVKVADAIARFETSNDVIKNK